jgi:hypothetical protein
VLAERGGPPVERSSLPLSRWLAIWVRPSSVSSALGLADGRWVERWASTATGWMQRQVDGRCGRWCESRAGLSARRIFKRGALRARPAAHSFQIVLHSVCREPFLSPSSMGIAVHAHALALALESGWATT